METNSASDKKIWVLLDTIIVLVGLLVLVGGFQLFTLSEELDWKISLSTTLGATLVATGLTRLLFMYHTRRYDLSESKIQALESAVSDDVFGEHGLLEVYEDRGRRQADEYESRLEAATEQVDILGCGLGNFQNDLGEEIGDWARDVDFRVLIMDPEFPVENHSIANQRDSEEEQPVGTIRSDVDDFIEETEEYRTNDEFGFEVRLYQCLPTVTIFRVDNEILWGPYTVKDESLNMPAFRVGQGGYLFEEMERHFEAIWTDPSLHKELDDG